jgi:hypothetical protein
LVICLLFLGRLRLIGPFPLDSLPLHLPFSMPPHTIRVLMHVLKVTFGPSLGTPLAFATEVAIAIGRPMPGVVRIFVKLLTICFGFRPKDL